MKSSAIASRRTAPFRADVNDIRFNFSPSFTRVGNQFVISSTTELCRALVDELQKEAKESPGAAAKTQQLRLIPSGAADLLKEYEDALVTQTILDQAVPPDAARKQVEAFVQWIRGLGEVDLSEAYTANEFQFDLRLEDGEITGTRLAATRRGARGNAIPFGSRLTGFSSEGNNRWRT